MDVDIDTAPAPTKPATPPTEPVPEADIYIRLLIIHHLLKCQSTHDKAKYLAHETVEKMQEKYGSNCSEDLVCFREVL
jgi:26S proteasome regulatory subunit N3